MDGFMGTPDSIPAETPFLDTGKIDGSVLEDALKLVRGSRNDEYGDPVAMYSKVAQLWNAYFNSVDAETRFIVKAHDVLMMMTLMKLGREMVRHKKDNLVDAAGYIELLAVAKGEAKL
jgi:hypothetical protein